MTEASSAVRSLAGRGPQLRAAIWHTLGLALVLLLPLQVRTGVAFWTSSLPTMLQAGVGALAYLLAALLAGSLVDGTRARAGLAAAAIVTATFLTLAILFLLAPEVPLSRALLGISFGLSLVLIVTSAMIPRIPNAALGAIGLAVIATALVGRAAGDAAAGDASSDEEFTVNSEFYLLRVGVHRAPLLEVEPRVEGGGLTRFGDDLLLVTGPGHFARIRLLPGDSLAVDSIPLASPANRDEFARDAGPGIPTETFRVIDLLAEEAGDSVSLHVSHLYWRAPERCYVLRVSRATAGVDLRSWSPWSTVFDAEPCLPIREGERGIPFDGVASGGRMIRIPDGLLVTVGDNLFDGYNSTLSLPRDMTSHYGKTVLIGPDGSARIFTSGHRNPQGLTYGPGGRIWSTEHGPQGGDELNLLEPGVDYGWPQRTLGTEYGMLEWPLLTAPSPTMREPAFAFVPSLGISSLTVTTGPAFTAWQDDLLIGTLRAHQLLRVRRDGSRPIYVERIDLRYEMRDVEMAGDGTLVIWTDQEALLTVVPDTSISSGGRLVVRCAGCHSLDPEETSGLGPNLFGVVDRDVAAEAGFAYSPALSGLGGRWTRDRLDAFLADPAAYVPGTAMRVPGLTDPDERRRLIDYLAQLTPR